MLGRLHLLKKIRRVLQVPLYLLKWRKKRNYRFFTLRNNVILGLGLVIGFGLIGAFLLYGDRASANWYHDSWGFRRKITIDNTKVSGSNDLANFPVLVSFTSDSSLSANAKTDGSDILFVDTKGQQLTHEIEYYSAGTLVAWVKIPTLSATVDTVIYMYYGNASASGLENETAVWSSDYRGVWHLSETSGQHQDSTSNNNDSTAVTVTTQGSATGKIGGADDFASGNEVVVADSDSLDITSSFTAQAWVKADTIGGSGTWNSIIYKGGNSNYFLELTNTDEIDAGFYGGGDWRSVMTTTDAVSTGSFYHLAVVHDAANDTIKTYVNGVEKATVSGITQTPLVNTSTFTIGENFYNETFDGIIDEVRLSDSPKSVDWLLTEYNNQNSPATFYSASHEEVRKRGPSAHWKFDEGYGAFVNDSSGNTVVGSMGTGSSAPTWTAEEGCISGNCIQMDGTDDFLSFGDNLDVEDGQDFTFSAWIKSNSFSTVQTVLAKKLGNSSGQVGYLINIGTGGTLNFYAADGTDQIWKGSSTVMSANSWYHIAFVYDEDNASNIAFYINGTATSGNLTGTLSNINSLANTQVLGVGVEPDGQYIFNGFIDEAKFYSYARTADEIKQDYFFAGAKGSSAVLGTQDSSFMSDGLVGYWKMDETTGSTGPSWTAADSSGNGNNGTGAGNAGPGVGKFGNGGSFDGTGDYISTGYSTFSTNTTGSICTWFKPDSLQDKGLYTAANNASEEYLELSIRSTGKLRFGVRQGVSYDYLKDSSISYTVSAWNHVCITQNATQPKIYINGLEDTNVTNTVAVVDESAWMSKVSGMNASCIARFCDTTPGFDFEGSLDEIRIYNRALSSSEVKSLYEWAPAPVAYWSMDASPTYSSTVTSRVNASSDDAEDPVSGGAVVLNSSDLELVMDGAIDQEVGMIFDNIDIAQGTTITNATIQFTVDEADSGTTNLTFYGDDTDNSSTFTTTAGNIRDRTKTSASVNWNSVPAWSTIGEAGSNQQTPDLSSIIQEIVNRSGWSSGNSLAIIVDGTGERTAESYDGSTSSAPLLSITCSPYCNNNSVSSLQDISGNNNTGTFYGSINGDSFTSGKYGKSLNFNGDADVVVVPDGEDLNFDGGSFTISTWFITDELPSNTTGADMLLSKAHDSGSADARGWEFILDDSTDKVRARLWDNTSDVGSSDGDAYSDNVISTNTWYHAAMVYAADTQELSLYINGVKQQSTATVESSDYAKDLTIGAYSSSGTHSFDGRLDDVKIYKYARSPVQIVNDMNVGHPTVGTPVGSTTLHYSFDEGYGSTIHDKSPSQKNGSLGSGVSAPSWSNDGQFNKALSFDGSNDYAYVTSPVLPTGDFTYSLWFNTSAPGSSDTLLYAGDGSGGNEFKLDKPGSGQVVSLRLNGSTACTGTITIEGSTWYHVVATRSGSDVKTYVNGELNCSSTYATALSFGSCPLVIGADDSSTSCNFSGINEGWAGRIDEVKVYSFALTEDQIKTEYKGGKTLVLGAKSTASDGITSSNAAGREYCVPGDTSTCNAPVAEWKFDEGTGTSAYDTSGNNLTGTLNNGPVWAPGKRGKAIKFDGIDDNVNVLDNDVLDFGTSTPFTVSYWMKMTGSSNADQDFFDKVSGNGFKIEYNGSLQILQAYIRNSAGNFCTVRTTTDPEDGQWRHVSVVFYRNASCTTSDILIYFNGEKQSTTMGLTTALMNDDISNTTDLNISDPTHYVQGYMDDIRIYNYARTPAQIAWEYNRGAPVAQYKFDECQGSTAYNSALNGDGKAAGNNGTITIGGSGTSSVGNCSTSSTAWGNGASGKINSSLSSDGIDDYVDMGDPSTGIFDPGTNDFSVSLWMKGGTQTNTLSRLLFKYQAIHLNANHTSICANKISFEKPSGNAGVCSNTSVNTNTWYHVTAVREGDIARVYINGVLEGTQTGWSSENAATNYSLTVGGYPSANHYFNGQIDDVRIYRYALTANQVRQVYTNGAVSFK